MQIFDEDEARYYCSNYRATVGQSQGSIKAYCRSKLRGTSLLREGTAEFDEYRDCSLRNVERYLFLAASNYSTSHKLMLSSSSSWAHVTLYYGAYYSAVAILGMFGVWMDMPKIFVYVAVGNVGTQQLTIRRGSSIRAMTTYKGSHKMFWDLFYRVIRPLHTWITEPTLCIALTPVSADPCWQTESRNEINYDSYKALDLSREFITQFKPRQFPTSLPGILNTQFTITESLTLLAFNYAKTFGINTDALDVLSCPGLRGIKINSLIFSSRAEVPVQTSKKARIIS